MLQMQFFLWLIIQGQQTAKKLKGKFSDLWRIRIGNYRVIYTIDDTIKIVDIKEVGDRKDIYE